MPGMFPSRVCIPQGGKGMAKIQVMGPGCKRCATLYENVKAAVEELGTDAEVEKVTDTMEMMKLDRKSVV